MKSLLGKNTRRPDISFNDNGRIDISARVSRALNLQPGDLLDVAVCDGECMLYVRRKGDEVSGRHSATCFPVIRRNTSGAYRLWCKKLYLAIADASGRKSSRLSFACGDAVVLDDVQAVPIILKLEL